MDVTYLYRHVSSELHTFIREYETNSFRLLRKHTMLNDFDDSPFDRAVIECRKLREAPDENPLILFVAFGFSYGWIKKGNTGFLIGPLRFEEDIYFSCPVSLEELGISAADIDEEWLLEVPLVPFDIFARDMLLLYNLGRSGDCDEPYLAMRDFIAMTTIRKEEMEEVQEEMLELIFENRERGFVHNPYNHEARECRAIMHGDVNELRRVLEEDFTGRYGVLSKNKIRQEINMGIVTITLATRAAIQGGLHPETAYYISDGAIQRMETLNTIPAITHVYRTAEICLAEMVHELKNKRERDGKSKENIHISHCKDYIFTHLHERLMVCDIAHAIGLEANYLSTLFKRHEHVTLKAYIMQEKIKLVKNLLVYSSYSYSKIAVYLGFASQSHLGNEFRKSTGMTLKEYRDAYARDDFVHDQMFESGNQD